MTTEDKDTFWKEVRQATASVSLEFSDEINKAAQPELDAIFNRIANDESTYEIEEQKLLDRWIELQKR